MLTSIGLQFLILRTVAFSGSRTVVVNLRASGLLSEIFRLLLFLLFWDSNTGGFPDATDKYDYNDKTGRFIHTCKLTNRFFEEFADFAFVVVSLNMHRQETFFSFDSYDTLLQWVIYFGIK